MAIFKERAYRNASNYSVKNELVEQNPCIETPVLASARWSLKGLRSFSSIGASLLHGKCWHSFTIGSVSVSSPTFSRAFFCGGGSGYFCAALRDSIFLFTVLFPEWEMGIANILGARNIYMNGEWMKITVGLLTSFLDKPAVEMAESSLIPHVPAAIADLLGPEVKLVN
jgi:hypothetical protein